MAERGLMTPADAAAYLSVSQKTLAQWRWKGTGPVFVPVGRLIRYRMTDLESWAASRARTHAGDRGPAA